MNSYDFELRDFALSDKGLHLLRDRYNYKTISYKEVEGATISNGHEIKNAYLSLVAGAALIFFSISKLVSLYHDFNDPDLNRIYIESILLPLFPALIGIYFLYAFLKRGPILRIHEGRSSYSLRLSEIYKNQKQEELIDYLRQKIRCKVIVEYPVLNKKKLPRGSFK